MHHIDRVVFTFCCFILFVAVCTALYGFWTNPDNLLRPAATHATSTAAAEKTSPGRSQPACGKRTYRRCFSGAKPKYWHMNIGSYRRQLIHYPSDTRLTVKQGKSIWIQGKGIFLHLWQEIRLCLPFQPSDKYIIHQQPILSEHKLSVGEKFSFHKARPCCFVGRDINPKVYQKNLPGPNFIGLILTKRFIIPSGQAPL